MSPFSQAAAHAGTLDQLLAAAAVQPSHFHCASRGICAAIHATAVVIAIDDAALIGAACDRADLVVVSIPVYLDTCRSGAILITSRSLRRSGSLAISVRPDALAGFEARNDTGNMTTRPRFYIKAALDGVIRPWTVQRYYQWRTNSYDLPG